MTTRDTCPPGLLQKGLTIVLLGYALAIQLFVGAYFQQKMVVAALDSEAVICSSMSGLAIGAHPADDPAGDQGKAHCLALCQLACGSGPALAAVLRDLPSHQPASQSVPFATASARAAVSTLYDTPQARGPPLISRTL
ncbi:DUF2946 family protein [Affinirhizobium pseudoryzae]|uniref:DUF2946 family protein n=1 Tax=Allorhizobium pseudoryzae TaxID=379684 RepID=UPI0013EC08B0|nr:DUF2946 family protein [Allorhizobium pseudoryzae]